MNGIKHIRKQLGMTQAEFAAAIGSEQWNVSTYEAGKCVLKPDLARRVVDLAQSRGFHCTLDLVYSAQPVLKRRRHTKTAEAI